MVIIKRLFARNRLGSRGIHRGQVAGLGTLYRSLCLLHCIICRQPVGAVGQAIFRTLVQVQVVLMVSQLILDFQDGICGQADDIIEGCHGNIIVVLGIHQALLGLGKLHLGSQHGTGR